MHAHFILGICDGTSSGRLSSGTVSVVLNVGVCSGFNETFNAYTGLNSVSTINIEEMPARELKSTLTSVGILI